MRTIIYIRSGEGYHSIPNLFLTAIEVVMECAAVQGISPKEVLDMETILTAEEVRVLGCILEKQIATPAYYPLTLSALINACNQKSSREPVVNFDEKTVIQALDGLREKKLVRMVSMSDSRVAKYRQVFTDTANLTEQELGILCVLILRGPQTVGEIRARTDRLCSFNSLEEVEKALQGLIDRVPGPLVMELPKQAGLKETRYAHLLSGKVQDVPVPAFPRRISTSAAEESRIARLEQEVSSLRDEIRGLKEQFSEFRKQFE